MSFAETADGALRLEDEAGSLSASVRLVGARAVPAEIARGVVLYRGAAPGGGDVVARPIPGGAEDWIVLGSAASPSFLDYDVALGPSVAGLRLVERTLELLDANGSPRFRMGAPVVVDRNGKKLRATTRVSACQVDTSPRAPFGRAVTAPGARMCRVRVAWEGSQLAYPAVVDPAWTATARLAAPRHGHVAASLSGVGGGVPADAVLVAGGQTTDPVETSVEVVTAEIWSQGAWAVTGSLAISRDAAAISELATGELLVSGGSTNLGVDVLASAEIYNPMTGTWRRTGDLAVPRAGHTSTEVGDGTVLISAGYDNSGDHFTEAELFRPATGTFVAAGKINQTRYFHSAVAIGGGRVLVGGGTDPASGALASLELYTAGVGWSPAAALAPMPTPRTLHSCAVLANGDVLFVGGHNAASGTLAGAERYSPGTNTWTADGSFTRARYDAAPATMPSGQVLFVSGQALGDVFADGELYDPLARTFLRVRGASTLRAYGHTATALPDGRVLAVGGRNPGPVLVSASDLFDVTLPAVDAGPDNTPDANDGSATADASPNRDASIPDARAPSDAGPDANVGAPDADGGALDASPGTGVDGGIAPPGLAPPARPTVDDGSELAGGGGCSASGVGTGRSSSSGIAGWMLGAVGWLAAMARGRRRDRSRRRAAQGSGGCPFLAQEQRSRRR